MSYDPTLPAPGSPLSSAEMRAQLQGLKELIDAVPILDSVQVDAVNTTPPGGLASVSLSVSGTTIHFVFDLPQGNDGPPGTIVSGATVDAVTTVDPGQPASVGVNFDGTTLRFTFGIPRGADGVNGAPGEVSQATLDTAIAGTAVNPVAVAPLNLVVSDPPTQTEVQAIASKVDELLAAIRRW